MTTRDGGIIIELLRNAVTGVNIIPTALLILVLLYWMTVIIGVFDIEIFDLESLDPPDFLSGLFLFYNIAELPFMLFFSMLTINFWILSMLVYYLPINPEGVLNGLLLIVTFILGLFLTKYESIPLKGIFKTTTVEDSKETSIIYEFCTLRSDLSEGRLGQARIDKEGPGTIINVKPEKATDSFKKGEVAIVSRKDENKNIFYIIKFRGESK